MSDHDQAPPPTKSSGLPGCLGVGCVVLLITTVVIGFVGYFGFIKLRDVGADKAYAALETELGRMDLEEGERIAALDQLARLRDGVQAGEVSFSEFGSLMENLEKSPLLALGGVLVGQRLLAEDENFSDEERASGRLALSRFARGVHEGTIPDSELQELMRTIGEEKSDGDIEINDRPTTEELRAMVAYAQEKADEAGLGPEELKIDLVGELRSLVDSVLDE